MKTVLLGILASDLVWPLMLALARIGGPVAVVEKVFQRVLYERISRKRAWIESFIHERIPDLEVAAGPFAGMKYPKLEAAGSMLAPKLLGSYESEIADIFQASELAQYDTVIDVGCAEGFYAVGIARLNPRCSVYAYDISPIAQNLCRSLAEHNDVNDRVQIGGLCSDEGLSACDGKRALIVSDCEGAEMGLFSDSIIDRLQTADLMIEVHEHLGADLDILIKRFDSTHDCKVVRCIMDADRLEKYKHPLVDGLSDQWRVLLFAECRSRANCWLIARSRSASSRT